jgi:hypothetical protein
VELIAQDDLTAWTINLLTDLHTWAAVASSLAQSTNTADADTSSPMGEEDLDRKFTITDEQKAELEEWVWHPSDLSVGGAWHATRIESLEATIAGRANSEQLHREGGMQL